MTKEELKAAVEAEFAKQNEPEPQPQSEIEEPEEGELYKTADGQWSVSIDLNDGSGVQSFKDVTKNGLIAKLTKAQEHATHKIKDLSRQVKESKRELSKPETKFEPSTLTDEEKFLLGQELQTNPTGAVAKLIKATVGATPDEIREALTEGRRATAALKAQQEGAAFITAHPEYANTPANEQAMTKYLNENSLAFTKANLEIAYEDLADTGLVSVHEEKEQQERIAPVAKRVEELPQRKRHVGLSTRQSVATEDEEPKPKQLTVEDMLKMSPEERRRIVMRSQSSSQR